MSLKQKLKKIKFINNLHNAIKTRRLEKKCKTKHIFENRSKGLSKACIVLAGYKQFLWGSVFARLKKFIDEDIDVCLVSSGLYSAKLSEICEKNSWSYISLKKNNVCLALNVAISEFPKAIYIYKLDEDIFITENYFNILKKTYEKADSELYNVGFVAPLIPINGYGNVKILEKTGKLDYYRNNFEQPKYASGRDRMIENNENVAKFMWGEGNHIPSIDLMNKIFNSEEIKYSPIPIRFSIGAILFKRSLWEEMQYFRIVKGIGMGADEEQICIYCMINSKAMLVCENVCVGHLSFGKQNEAMEKYYLENKNIFDIV